MPAARASRPGVSAIADPDSGDAFAVASSALHGRRPIRNARLRAIASRALDAAAAEKDLRQYLLKAPEDADALYLLAQNVRRTRLAEASSLLARCLQIAPNFAAARFRYADVLQRSKEFESALVQLELLLSDEPHNPLFRQLKAIVLESMGESTRAHALYQALVTENPARSDSWLSYGHSLRAAGRQDESIAAYRKAIEIQPANGRAYWALANMKTVQFGDDEVHTMEALLREPGIPESDRILIQYALGKAYEDRGAFHRSFEHYARANAAMRLRVPYDPDQVTRQVKASKSFFTAEFFGERKGGNLSPEPIFVVSLPRSGSTLIEQILCSHSSIEAAGELPHITTLVKRFEQSRYPYVLGDLDAAALATLGEEYLARASVHRKLGRPYFVDKKPPNFFYLGFIRLILPNAKIIDVRRNPGACCFSMFRQYFRKPRPRQAELARLYRDYVELMAHFDRVLPGKVHRVIYEELVVNPETEIRRLFEYLELPFEPGCLKFYETQRSVRTPSSEQVRRPISTEAVDHWRNYEEWLGPLIKNLGSVLTSYPAVPADLQ